MQKQRQKLTSIDRATGLLESAKKLLSKDGHLLPVLFCDIEGENKTAIVPVEFTNHNHNDKTLRLFAIGEAIRQTSGKKILEAVFISDTFYLELQKDSSNSSDINSNLPVRNHPLRREAILLIGRNLEGTARVSIMQPYNRTGEKITFDDKPIIETNSEMLGMIDYVFGLEAGRMTDELMQKMDAEKTKYGKN